MATALRRPAVRSLTTAASASPKALALSRSASGPFSPGSAGFLRGTCSVSEEVDVLPFDSACDSRSVASSSKIRLGCTVGERRCFSSSAASSYAPHGAAAAVAVVVPSLAQPEREAVEEYELELESEGKVGRRSGSVSGGRQQLRRQWVGSPVRHAEEEEELLYAHEAQDLPARSQDWSADSSIPPSSSRGKGKARQIDDRDSLDGPESIALQATFYPTPLGLTIPPQLYLPTEAELLQAVEHLPDVYDLWRRALVSDTLGEALHVLSESALEDDMHNIIQRLPSVLLYLRLFHRIQSSADIKSALQLLQWNTFKSNYTTTSLSSRRASLIRQASKARLKWDVPHTAYALSVLLERALRDLKAVDLIPALLQHVLALTRRVELRYLALMQHSAKRTSVGTTHRHTRFLRRKGKDSRRRHLNAQLTQEHEAVQQLHLRLAKLLTYVQDQRALRAATSLIRHIGSRSPLWQNFAQRDTYSALETTWTGLDGVTFPRAEHEWRAPIRSLIRWRRRRKVLCRRLRLPLSSIYEPNYVARVCRVLLGSGATTLGSPSESTLELAVLLPPPLTERLDDKPSAYFVRDSQDVGSVLASSKWLDKDMVEQCLAYLRMIASHFPSTILLSASDLAVSLMTAVREQDADLAAILIHDLGEVARRSRSVEGTSFSPRPHSFEPSTATPINGLTDLLTAPFSLMDSFRSAQQNEGDLPAYLESGLFHYIDILARKEVEGGRKKLIDTQPFSQAVAKKLFERIARSHAQSRNAVKVHAQTMSRATTAKLQAKILTGGTMAKGMETLARDVRVPVQEVLACFRLDAFGRDVSVSQPRSADFTMDASGNGAAYGPALRGFALRGQYGAADVLFRAFVRRATTMPDAYPSLRLHPYILTFRWLAEVQRVQGFARVEAATDAKRSRVEARRALSDILMFIDVQVPEPSTSAKTHAQTVPTLDRKFVVKPSAKLMTSVVFSLSRDWGARRAAVATWLAMEKRWPQVARDAGYLQTLILTARAMCVRVSKRKRSASDDPSMISRRVFRQWLFSQYPELHPDAAGSPAAPTWIPEGSAPKGSLVKSGALARQGSSSPTPSSSHRSVDFNADMFHAYASLISSMLELRGDKKSSRPQSIAIDPNSNPTSAPAPYASQIPDPLADTQPTQSEFFLILAWMRALNIQPSNQTLCLFGGHLWRVYKRNHWVWPRGSRFEKQSAHTDRIQRRYEGMGPLNDWLAEWLEQRWPTGYEVSAYARYTHQVRKLPPSIWDI
ncbi:hypothetical protein CF327_g1323 [Tilletia walkeri]|uniref:Uncharacterized protein n=1 Tax=Tilletia walkeri TaxID=117179 RepID=A0A8X7NFD9_9BASI|nr:hypothetical protein CF327_g1323 [Tilletia walkeri]KAE8271290.1 hypothetical protein A4X09_0g1035 [Tilletia walkeri]